MKEGTRLAKKYNGKSVAEQNSVNLAWSLLQDSKYNDLRNAICETQEEQDRFRQLVVNSVMATDIMDKDLKKLRDNRWETAFATDQQKEESEQVRVNRKATIVIEHLIQASDVAHTMQHWHIYRKWNERLFNEMHKAYLDGRSEKGPGMNWYYGEIGFFDFYIIPLAKKLSECGVFGVSSDEYLNYALENRREWEKKGREVVQGYLDRLEEKKNEEKENPSSSTPEKEKDVVQIVGKNEKIDRAEEDMSLHRIKTNIALDIDADSISDDSFDDDESTTFDESESTSGSVSSQEVK